MSKIPDLLRQLADAYEEEETYQLNHNQTIISRVDEIDNLTNKNNDKIKEIANAFASFANILGRED